MTKEKAIESLTWIKEKLVISEDYKEALDMAIDALKVKAVQGEWHKTENEEMEITGYYCSVCDMPTYEPTNYCPNCGAKMDK